MAALMHRSDRRLLYHTLVFFSLVVAAATVGCATRRPAPALPRENMPAPSAKELPAPAPSITEEVVTTDTLPLWEAAPSAPAAKDAAQPEPESVLAMIQPTTPPNVAAATRLVEAARAEIAAGNIDAAVENLEQAIDIDPSNPYAYYFLAETHFKRGMYNQAVTFADKAALLSAADPAWSSRSYCLQGRTFEVSGRFADARASYAQALEADDQNRTAWEGLIRLGGMPPEQP